MEVTPAAPLASPSFTPARKWRIGLNVTVCVIASLACVVLANLVSARHFTRLQWSRHARQTLSPLTVTLLRSITNQVKAIVFFDRQEPLYSPVAEMIDEYQAICPKLDVEFLDYVIYAGRAEQVKTEYHLASGGQRERNCVIFHCNNRSQVVDESQLSTYDFSGLLSGKEIKRAAFNGEALFTAALLNVISASPNNAYFLAGHGEADPANTDNQDGYSKFAQILQENNVRLAKLSLISSNVPADCQLLVIAAPRNPIPKEELDKVERYLNQGGRLAVFFRNPDRDFPQAGLERLLGEYGLKVSRDIVIDKANSFQDTEELVLLNSFGAHPIVGPLARSRVCFYLPRPVGRAAGGPADDGARVTELIFSAPTSKAAFTQRAGPFSLMAAAEKGDIQGLRPDVGVTRIVAMGDFFAFGNALIDAEANRDLARLTINWLLNRNLLLQGIGPHPVVEYQIALSKSQMDNLRWLFLLILPGSVVAFGAVVWLRRRA